MFGKMTIFLMFPMVHSLQSIKSKSLGLARISLELCSFIVVHTDFTSKSLDIHDLITYR